MGAGVAGLMAIGTARRLGAVVEATDVRPVVKEQVESLGGTFIEVEMTEEEKKSAETAGGYATEMSDDYKRRQAELIAAAGASRATRLAFTYLPAFSEGYRSRTAPEDAAIDILRLSELRDDADRGARISRLELDPPTGGAT